MDPVNKALWFIESHFAQDITLDTIAAAGGVSRYYLSRAFGYSTGHSIMRYVRGRRLTQSARALVNGAPDILAVALDAGYSSHEAFTRAFREQFGFTPEAVRAQGNLDNIELMEPLKMEEILIDTLETPRFVTGKALLIAGLGERCDFEGSAGIPAQWQRFVPHIGRVAGQVDGTAYGVCCNSDDAGNFEYVCGVEVRDFSGIPKEWARVRIPEQHYAVFVHRDHVSKIRSTWHTIWNKWLPESGYQVIDAPFYERYGEEFDSQTGMGGAEIWLPVSRSEAW
jgi:AraC family transcriptional regulator